MLTMVIVTVTAFARPHCGPSPRMHHGGGFRPAPMYHGGYRHCAPPVHHYNHHGFGYYGGRWYGRPSYAAGFVAGAVAGAVVSSAVDAYGNYIVPGRANCGHTYYTAPAVVPASYPAVYTPPVMATAPVVTTTPVVAPPVVTTPVVSTPLVGAGVQVGPVGVGVRVGW